MRSPSFTALLFGLLSLPACSPSFSPASPASDSPSDAGATGPFYLHDAQGRVLLLHGCNLAGANKTAPYFGFQKLPDVQRVRQSWGMNAIRFLISWAAIEPEKGVYDDDYLSDVAMRMDWAQASGLLVVLDMHQDIYGEGFAGGDGAPRWTCPASEYAAFTPQSDWFFAYNEPSVVACYDGFWKGEELRAHYAEAWRRVAARLSGYDGTIVGFDVMNEPFWGSAPIDSFEATTLAPFYAQVVPIVRGERPGWTAFLEPASSRNLGFPTSLTPPPFGNAVYAPHAYDAAAETGMGFDPADAPGILQKDLALAAEAQALGEPLWIGEYGGFGNGLVDYMTAELDGAMQAVAGSTYWSYDAGGSYSLLNADFTEKQPLVDTIVRPWAERIAGEPVSMAFDAPSSTFTLVYRPDPSIAAPTEIAIPPRSYPNGYRVDCGGCTVTRAAGLVSLSGTTAGEVTVVIRP